MRPSDITEEDRELYYEIFGVPFKNVLYKYEVGITNHIATLDNEFDLIKRADVLVIDYLMGTSGIIKDLIDSDYVHTEETRYDDLIASHNEYTKVKYRNKCNKKYHRKTAVFP